MRQECYNTKRSHIFNDSIKKIKSFKRQINNKIKIVHQFLLNFLLTIENI